MLTEDDLKKLILIRAEAMRDPDGPASRADLAFLARLIERLSLPRADIGDFPPYAALVNAQSYMAYAMRLVRPVARESQTQAKPGVRSPLLSYQVICQIVESELAVRPYLRLHAQPTPELLERLSQATLTLTVDGGRVLDRFQARLFLADPEGIAIAGVPFSMKGYVPKGGEPCFYACALVSGPEATGTIMPQPHTMDGPPGFIAAGDLELGLMLVNGTQVDLALEGLGGTEPIPLTAGVVSALYSTKSREEIRKQDWSPRTHEGTA